VWLLRIFAGPTGRFSHRSRQRWYEMSVAVVHSARVDPAKLAPPVRLAAEGIAARLDATANAPIPRPDATTPITTP
jgi:hypothetical protein